VIDYYNLDMVIFVDYWVKLLQRLPFRQGATCVVRDHIVEDYTVNQLPLQQLNRAVKLITKIVR